MMHLECQGIGMDKFCLGHGIDPNYKLRENGFFGTYLDLRSLSSRSGRGAIVVMLTSEKKEKRECKMVKRKLGEKCVCVCVCVCVEFGRNGRERVQLWEWMDMGRLW